MKSLSDVFLRQIQNFFLGFLPPFLSFLLTDEESETLHHTSNTIFKPLKGKIKIKEVNVFLTKGNFSAEPKTLIHTYTLLITLQDCESRR